MHGEKTVANLFEAYIAGLYYCYMSPDTAVSGTVSRGQAIDQVYEWLRELYTPLAQWVVETLRNEQAIIQAAAQAGHATHGDLGAAGSLARVNEHFIAKEATRPTFDLIDSESGLWRIKCTAITKDGIIL